MSPLAVTISAMLMRSLPIIFGLVIARFSGIEAYADFVLALSLFNIVASAFQLGIVPQVIRSEADGEWGIFLRKTALVVVAAYVPVAGVVFFFEPALQAHSAVSFFAASSAFGLLAGSTAGALQCRSQRFVEFLAYACGFFALCVVPVLVGLALTASIGALLTIAGAWIACIGFSWLLAVLRQERVHTNVTRNQSTMWREFLRDGASSASFGLVIALGFYAVNRSAVWIEDGNSRAVIAFGLQVLSVIIFVPGALSSYVVPTLRSRVREKEVGKFVTQSARAYLAIAAVIAGAVWALQPALESLYRFRIAGADSVTFAFLLVASVIAAGNAIINQVLVAWRRFVHQLLLALLWLAMLVTGLLIARRNPVAISGGLLTAYMVLAVASLVSVWRSDMLERTLDLAAADERPRRTD